MAVTDIEQGSHVRTFELRDPKDASRAMATLKVGTGQVLRSKTRLIMHTLRASNANDAAH